jgi:hypothetical protein
LLPSRPPGLVPSRSRSWGLSPPRPCSSCDAVRSLERRVPRGSDRIDIDRPLQGLRTPHEARPVKPEFTQQPPSNAPLGFSPPRFLVQVTRTPDQRSHSPSRAFPDSPSR